VSLNVSALRRSFELIAPRADRFADRFYEKLFADFPEVRPLFGRTDLADQRRMLIQMLTIVMRSLEQPAVLSRVLGELGARHVDYGVREEHYPLVARTLMGALREFAGEAWTDEFNTAWTEALYAVAGLMLEGAKGRQPARAGVEATVSHSSGGAVSPAVFSDRSAVRSAPREGHSMTVETSWGVRNGSTAATPPAEQTALFYGMVEASPAAMMAVLGDGTIFYANRKAQELLRQLQPVLGFGPQDLVGGPVRRLFRALPEIDLPPSRSLQPRTVKARAGNESLEIVMTPISDANGDVAGELWLWELTTERARAEEARADTLGQIAAIGKSNAVISFNLDGTILDANENFLGAVGYRLDEIRGKHHSMFVDDNYRRSSEYREFWAQLNRGEYSSGEYRRIGKGGKEIWIQASYNPIIDAHGKPFKVVKYASDITAQVKARQEMIGLKSVLENLPFNVILADTSLKITYLNPSSVTQLTTLEKFLPIKVKDIVGQSIDIFHKNPAHQRNLLGNTNNLPHRAQIKVGPETLDLLVSPVRDDKGNFLGPMVTWEVITEKLRIQNEVARIQNMMDQMNVNVMLANRDFELVYMNPASANTLRKLQHLLPAPVDQLVGRKIDIFHKNPEHQRRMLSDPRNLPHNAKIKLGAETLDLRVAAINDKDGNFVGPMVTWSVITETVKMADDFESSIKTVVGSVTAGAAQVQGNSRNMAATAEETARQAQVVAAASEEATKNVETVSSAAEELSASIAEIARHVQDASRMTQQAVQEANRTNLTIKDLGESSNQIGQVIKVITSIAQQTNLLALNATIEAARAGEAGKGFAVVANEVKELARQTAKATEEISQKIGAIQSATGVAITAIGSIGDSIGRINEISTTIASAVEEQTAATNEISRNVSEAAKGTAEVSNNITGVSGAAEEGGRAAAEMLQASENLTTQSQTLDHLTNDFLKRMRAL
jgi:methyl-accepting chemotaxis protein